mmetsp:Transcript_606/g.1426  ORF Transcript_606/g.1426 Transcript_606/m.1426 type:complete len:433 (-) Transcript_606:104-1402(-)
MGECEDLEDLPSLVGKDGEELAEERPEAGGVGVAHSPQLQGNHDGHSALSSEMARDVSAGPPDAAHEGSDTDEAMRTAAALRATAALQQGEAPSAADALRDAMAEAEDEDRVSYQEASEVTKRMIQAISRDDFEECEDAILQGADVNADCGAGSAGMRALHISALRGEMFLTELLISHAANVNDRDMAGNTPLLYACHFYRQHGKGPQMTAQLLYHKADPFYRVKDGKLAGASALDIMERACKEPNLDEGVPRQMCALIKLALEGREECREAIIKTWMAFKSEHPKLYQMSSRRDSYHYAMKNIDWLAPENTQACTPVRLEEESRLIFEEKFVDLKDYRFTDEGDTVKVYVTFPSDATAALSDKNALRVQFELQAFDLKLRAPTVQYRLRIEPLFGSINVEESRHRASSSKVTLVLVKRHKNRSWPAIQKPR